MMDLILMRINFYEKWDIAMGYSVRCSRTPKVLIHTSEDVNVHTVHSPANT